MAGEETLKDSKQGLWDWATRMKRGNFIWAMGVDFISDCFTCPFPDCKYSPGSRASEEK